MVSADPLLIPCQRITTLSSYPQLMGMTSFCSFAGFQQPQNAGSDPQSMHWYFAGGPPAPQAPADSSSHRPAAGFAAAGGSSNGQRGPLAFVDSIFGETEGEFHSMLGEWEQQLDAMQQDDGPQAMHVSFRALLCTVLCLPTSSCWAG